MRTVRNICKCPKLHITAACITGSGIKPVTRLAPVSYTHLDVYKRQAIGDTPLNVMYSTHSLISRTVPLPKFPFTYVLQPNCLQSSKNSCVPKLLSSTTPPQCVLIIFFLFSLGPVSYTHLDVYKRQSPYRSCEPVQNQNL